VASDGIILIKLLNFIMHSNVEDTQTHASTLAASLKLLNSCATLFRSILVTYKSQLQLQAIARGMYELPSDICPRNGLIHMALERYKSHMANIKMFIQSCCQGNGAVDFVEYLVNLICISGTFCICVWNAVVQSETVSNDIS
jgi:hypothetical protein